MNLDKIRQEICDIGQMLHAKSFLAAADGNISVRVDEQRIVITPSGRHKGSLEPSYLAMITPDDQTIAGTPSSESAMHCAIYAAIGRAKAIVHAHPVHCIAWTVAKPTHQELPLGAVPEVLLGMGRAPIIPYAPPGSKQLAENLAKAARESRVLIMARHGVVSWGESLIEAYMGIERVEHAAHVLTMAQLMGGVTELSQQEVTELRKLRSILGEQTR